MSSQDHPSLIAKFAASTRAAAKIPVPMMVSLFQRNQASAGSEPLPLLAPSARQACTMLQRALREQHNTITLIGARTATLSVVIKAALASLDCEWICNAQIGAWNNLPNEIFSRIGKARGVASGAFVLVVDNAHRLPVSALQSLMLLSEKQERFSIQVLLAGQPDLSEKLATGPYKAFASSAKVMLEPEMATNIHSRIEDDLASGWRSGEAATRSLKPPAAGAPGPVISPFPALAALLGQSAATRATRPTRLIAAVIVAAFVLCLFGGLMASHHRI